MGDIADAILDGDLCEGCGIAFEDSGDGYPRKCAGCRKEAFLDMGKNSKKRSVKHGNAK